MGQIWEAFSYLLLSSVSSECYMLADPEDDTVFHYTDGNPYPGQCAPGTKFSQEDCACVFDSKYDPILSFVIMDKSQVKSANA